MDLTVALKERLLTGCKTLATFFAAFGKVQTTVALAVFVWIVANVIFGDNAIRFACVELHSTTGPSLWNSRLLLAQATGVRIDDKQGDCHGQQEQREGTTGEGVKSGRHFETEESNGVLVWFDSIRSLGCFVSLQHYRCLCSKVLTGL